MIKFPKITIDISKCQDTIDIEGKVHGQMKNQCLSKNPRREFTNAIRQANTWEEAIKITKEWVNIK